MTEFLLQLSLPLSLLLVALMLAQKYLLTRLGARSLYALWAAVPLLVISQLLSPLLSFQHSALVLQRYQVGLQQVSDSANSSNMLFYLWLAGVVAVLGYLALSYGYNKALYQRAKAVAPDNYPAECRLAADNYGPYITGLTTPRILLPHDFFSRFSSMQQALILQHELTHWRRGDLHLNYLALLLLAMCWFNPICWLAYRSYRQAQELSCDALVTQNASTAEKIAYGHALLSSTQQSSVQGWPLTHHYGDYNDMKQRLNQLRLQQGFSKTAVMVVLSAAMLGGVMLTQPGMAKESAAVELRPIVRIEPKYPITAVEQGIEGYVQLSFDLEFNGSVSNVQVVKAYPSDIFNDQAIIALKKWRYASEGRVVKGNVVQLDFSLQESADGVERIQVTPSNHQKSDQ